MKTAKQKMLKASTKEGYLLKQGRSFQRWRRRFFKLKGRKLYYAAHPEAVIFNELDLVDFSVAECSSKSAHTFQVITPVFNVILCADTRKEMDDWMQALRITGASDSIESGAAHHLAACGETHAWFVSSHARPTYCNACRDALSGVAWHGLSCEVCKLKSHKRCAVKVAQQCKWTTFNSITPECVITDDDGVEVMPHQWIEGNVPMAARCAACEKTCGSVLRLQDWRCLWCKVVLHDGSCRDSYPRRCPLGDNRLSVLPPVAIGSLDRHGNVEIRHSRNLPGSPLLALVNSKSGDNQGVKVLRRFRRLLNPAQVFDLMDGGPTFGLHFFKAFESFRVLVCGGDGSVGWVLSALDKLNLHSKCQLGIVPLGTGNDLARVLGWGNAYDDHVQLSQLVEHFERAHTRMLDRWSVLTYEGPTHYAQRSNDSTSITRYEDSVAAHLSKILSSDEHTVVISSARVLCETVKDFLSKISDAPSLSQDSDDGEPIASKCQRLQQKLDNLLRALETESEKAEAESRRRRSTKDAAEDADGENSSADSIPERPSAALKHQRRFVQREALMSRANSLKKVIREIIEHAERAVDEQNLQTSELDSRARKRRSRFAKFRSRTTPESRTNETTNEGGSERKKQESLPPSPPLKLVLGETMRIEDSDSPGSPDRPGPIFAARTDRQPGPSGASDSTVPEDPSSNAEACRSLRPSNRNVVQVQPPTPVSLTPSYSQPSFAHATFDVSPSSKDSFQGDSPMHALTPSHVYPDLRAVYIPPGVRPSLSDSSLKDVDWDERAAGEECRKVSKGSAFRLRPTSPGAFTVGSLIAGVLLPAADVLCVAATPRMDFRDVPVEQYTEKKVMNNYFGIGLDAKIALEFHQKREEYKDKARSRSKLYMWYGMLGTKELLQRTYRGLEQTVHLECDGRRIQLPSLQGIVILNIPSYQGGANFWGGRRGDDSTFSKQSFDDRVLEVMAVFGIFHCATSRLVRLQNHRIAQCREVKIIITGDEAIPIQVDGEPEMQPPGYIHICHKNRAQVLVRNRQFEATLRTWTERQRAEEQKPPACLLQMYTLMEARTIVSFVDAAHSLLALLRNVIAESSELKRKCGGVVEQASAAIQRLYPPAKKMPEAAHLHYHLVEAVGSMKQLMHELSWLLDEQCSAEVATTSQQRIIEEEPSSSDIGGARHEQLAEVWRQTSDDLMVVSRILGVSQSLDSLDRIRPSHSSGQIRRHSGPGKAKTKGLAGWIRSATSKWRSHRLAKSKPLAKAGVAQWTVEEVASWLATAGLAEYSENFVNHDVTGSELLKLERTDLKELGVDKVGHIKRLQSAIQNLQTAASKSPAKDSLSSEIVDENPSSF